MFKKSPLHISLRGFHFLVGDIYYPYNITFMKTLPIVASLLVIVVITIGVYVGGLLPSPTIPQDDGILPSHDTSWIISATKISAGDMHTYQGVIALPTPCHNLSIDTTIAESYPEQITLNFYVTLSDGICAQVITEREFKIEFNAHPDHILRATLNGAPADIQIVPIRADAKEDTNTGDIELAPL